MATSALKRMIKFAPRIPLYQLLLFCLVALLILIIPFSYQNPTVSTKQDDTGWFPMQTPQRKPFLVPRPNS